MNTYPSTYATKISKEISETPDEYLPALLAIVRLFRESVTLKPANDSFMQGWKETMNSELLPLDELWEGINVAQAND
jgi:hypothetical protein